MSKFCSSHVMSSVGRVLFKYDSFDLVIIRCLNCGVDKQFHIDGIKCLDVNQHHYHVDFITPQDLDHVFFRKFHKIILEAREALYE